MSRTVGPRHHGGAAHAMRPRRIAVALLLVLVLVVLLGGGWFGTALLKPLPGASLALDDPTLDASPAVDLSLPCSGSAAIAVLGDDSPLVEAGSTDPRPIGSITKVITVLAVLDRMPLAPGEEGPSHVVTAVDAGYYAANAKLDLYSLPTPVGTTLTERQLLEATLIPSSASHDMILAAWAFGSLDAAADAGNAWLAAHGLDDTHLVETSGIADGDVSTPRDLLRLGQLALANPVVAGIVAEAGGSVPGSKAFENTNRVLGFDGIDGIKTGNTTTAGYCLLFTAPVAVGDQTIRLVGVVLGLKDWDAVSAAVEPLLSSTIADLAEPTVSAAGTTFGEYSTAWGSTAHATLAADAAVLSWDGETATATVDLPPRDRVTAGETVGSVTFTTSLDTVTVPLVADATTTDPSLGWRLTHILD